MTEPVAIHDRALHSIQTIREAMERASAFTSIPGWGGCVIGALALITSAIASQFVTRPRIWVLIWIASAVVAVTIAAFAMVRKARRANVSLAGPAARRFFVAYGAPLIAAAVLTLALVRLNIFTPLPAVWLLCYGASFISSGSFSIRVVPLMGISFMLLGIVASFVPLAIGNLFMAAGFGGLHIIFGFVIARSYGG